MNDIPPAVTLYWQEERIKELEAEVAALRIADCSNPYGCRRQRSFDEHFTAWEIERRQLQTLLSACQKALREMQAQRDAAREGKR